MAALSTREKERKEMKIGCISICRYMAPHWDLKASDIILKERVSVTGPNLEQSVPKRTLLILRWFDFYKVSRILFTDMKTQDWVTSIFLKSNGVCFGSFVWNVKPHCVSTSCEVAKLHAENKYEMFRQWPMMKLKLYSE